MVMLLCRSCDFVLSECLLLQANPRACSFCCETSLYCLGPEVTCYNSELTLIFVCGIYFVSATQRDSVVCCNELSLTLNDGHHKKIIFGPWYLSPHNFEPYEHFYTFWFSNGNVGGTL
jgi:hypothetical protein